MLPVRSGTDLEAPTATNSASIGPFLASPAGTDVEDVVTSRRSSAARRPPVLAADPRLRGSTATSGVGEEEVAEEVAW